MFGLSVLANLADAIVWAREHCADFGVDPTPANVALVVSVYDAPLHADGRPVDREAWNARHHQTTVTRSRKGRSVVNVHRHGVPFVIGAHDIPVLLEVCGRKLRGGWSSIAVQRATDRMYRGQIPTLLGTDVMTGGETVRGDRSTLGPDAKPKRMSWPTRTRLAKPRRRDADPVAAWADPDVVASADRPDAMFVRHTLVTRGEATNARTARAARTVGAYRAENLASALENLRTMTIDSGQRLTFTGDDWTLAVTRGKSRRPYRATLARDGAESVPFVNAVSPASLADRITRTA